MFGKDWDLWVHLNILNINKWKIDGNIISLKEKKS